MLSKFRHTLAINGSRFVHWRGKREGSASASHVSGTEDMGYVKIFFDLRKILNTFVSDDVYHMSMDRERSKNNIQERKTFKQRLLGGP